MYSRRPVTTGIGWQVGTEALLWCGARALGVLFCVLLLHAGAVHCASVSDGFDFPMGDPDDGSPFVIVQEFLDPQSYTDCGKDWVGHLADDFGGGGISTSTPIKAAASGVVVDVDDSQDKCTGWGHACIIRHTLPDGSQIYSQYAHFSSLLVDKNDEVKRGQVIGYAGDTGHDGPFDIHLDFQIKNTPAFADGYTFSSSPTGSDCITWPLTGSPIKYYRPSTFINEHRPFTVDSWFKQFTNESAYATWLKTGTNCSSSVVPAWCAMLKEGKRPTLDDLKKEATNTGGALNFPGRPQWLNPTYWTKTEITTLDIPKNSNWAWAYKRNGEIRWMSLSSMFKLPVSNLDVFRIEYDDGCEQIIGYISRLCGNHLAFAACSGSLTVRKFRDVNMNGLHDDDEDALQGWPLKLTGTTDEGETVGPLYRVTGAGGIYRFAPLENGIYTVSEASDPNGYQLTWRKFTRSCDSAVYRDWRTNPWPSASSPHWQFTGAVLDGQTYAINVADPTLSAPMISGIRIECNDRTAEFGNVCLTPVTVCKFEDRNMNTAKDASEDGLQGFPITLEGTRADGKKLCLDPPVRVTAGQEGCYVFGSLTDLLPPGEYTVAETGNGIAWETRLTACPGTAAFYDLITGWNGRRWLSTLPRPEDSCPEHDPLADTPFPSYCFALDGTSCQVRSFTFGNVCLTTVPAFKFHDLNMDGLYGPTGEPFTDLDGDTKWTRAEPLTDLNCNGKHDDNEFFRDIDGDGKWDPAEPFTDADGDGQYDWPECPLVNWPFAFNGNRIDGKPVCLTAVTDDAGMVVFEDIAPADAAGYDLYEDLDWCDVNIGWPQMVKRTSFDNQPPCNGPQECPVTRWQATTEVSQIVTPYCEPEPLRSFGNVCLASVSGTKLVFDDGMPGDVDGKPGAGWEICLAGEDHNSTPIIPSLLTGQPDCAAYANAPAATKDPIGIPCITPPKWYSTVTAADGSFSFVDLLPGHYHLTEQPHPDYRMRISEPMLCGFDLICCPTDDVRIDNIRKGLAAKVYQAYRATSEGQDLCFAGTLGAFGDVISAVPGVLCICPGKDWTKYTQAAQLCREQGIKDVVIVKDIPETIQCGDVFTERPGYPGFSQHGSERVRLWWPLMFEVPGTQWTLKIIYGTRTKVQFPGETEPSYIHVDEWRWVVDANLQSMKLAISLFHELPYGLCEVPLISGEQFFQSLLDKLDEVQAAIDAKNIVLAGQLLVEFEMLVLDECTAECPDRALGSFVGVVDSFEYPVCCKLLVDAEYVGRKLGIWHAGQ